MQFVLASHNKKKLAELSAIVSSLGIEIIPLPEGAPEPEENGKTFEKNALIKAKSAAEFIHSFPTRRSSDRKSVV